MGLSLTAATTALVLASSAVFVQAQQHDSVIWHSVSLSYYSHLLSLFHPILLLYPSTSIPPLFHLY